MARLEFAPRQAALLIALLIGACASPPKLSEPLLRRQAQEAEADGARRHGRGDYAGAIRSFGTASRLRQSFDDPAAAARNALNQAHAELALGQAEAARNRARLITHPELVLEVLLLRAQASLTLGQLAPAQEDLAAAVAACTANCPLTPSLKLLQARAALAGNRAPEALTLAEAALKLLQDKDEAAETGNAWRLIAAARLASGDAAGALPAARAALDIDRQLALPEKIARDWLLIGDIQRKVMRSGIHPDGAGDAATAYRRALDVANAAGLAAAARLANQALAEVEPVTETAR